MQLSLFDDTCSRDQAKGAPSEDFEARYDRETVLLNNSPVAMDEEYNYEDATGTAMAAFANHHNATLGNDCGACVALAARA